MYLWKRGRRVERRGEKGEGRLPVVELLLALVLFLGLSGAAWASTTEVNGGVSHGPLPSSIVRNPFQPPPSVTKKLLQTSKLKRHVPQSPLEKYDLESFVLKGIVADMAMVVSPDGNTYIIRKGTRIGKGGEVVVGIYGDRVAVKRGGKVLYLTFPKD